MRISKRCNPKKFLQVGGILLIVLSILGFIGVIGSTPEKSIFGVHWYFDYAENWTLFVIGIFELISTFVLKETLQRYVVVSLGVFGAIVGLYSFLVDPIFLGVHLENPADTIFYLIIAVWAFYSAFTS